MTAAARILAQAEARLDIRQRFRIERARAQRALARIKFDPSEPRDEGGKWTDGGGAGDDKLGPGYSDEAKLKDGVIHTSNVYDAVLALSQNRKVELKQPKQVSTLIAKLGEITKEMAAKGEKAPNYDLCNVTVKGTNLFCADTKGIPRIKMPQMDEQQTKAFLKHLEAEGYKVEKGHEKSTHLRATQSQLIGAKVAKLARRIEKEGEGGEADQRRLVVSRDNYILDGHHHWGAQIAIDAKNNKLGDHKTRISRVDISITKLLEEANKFTGGKGAQGIDDKSLKARWAKASDEARRWLKEWDESQHPRVPAGSPDGGEFGSGGGGEGSAAEDAHLDPKVIAVGGNSWNKATARRLEREYQKAKPSLDALTAKYAGLDKVPDEAAPPEDEDEEPPYAPDSWDAMHSDDQDAAFEKYKEQTTNHYFESEKQNWYDNGDALDEAKVTLADNPDDGDWLKDAIQEHLDNSDTRYPLTAEQLADGMLLKYESGSEGNGDFTVDYLDKTLHDMIAENVGDKNQQTLPGIEPEDMSKRLTAAMRSDLSAAIEKAFDKKADEKSGELEPPDYLKDNAAEFVEEDWQHNMSDKSKFDWVKNNTDILPSDGGPSNEEEVTGLPVKFDPLNETTGADYKRTQQLARTLSIQRTEQVLQARDLPYRDITAIRNVDSNLWRSWKSSSTSPDGQLLQVASADELGGRLNPKTGRDGKIELDRDAIIKRADSDYKDIGGYAGIKAYVRAKWETTQYLLDKAGIAELKLYRGIALDKDTLDQATREKLLKQLVSGHDKVPNLTVVRNGAASTTTDPTVANDWSSHEDRLVLRALVPRTAALSVPAYGINVQSEHEVVVTGTAWKGWDAWLRKAPDHDRVPLALAA